VGIAKEVLTPSTAPDATVVLRKEGSDLYPELKVLFGYVYPFVLDKTTPFPDLSRTPVTFVPLTVTDELSAASNHSDSPGII